MHAHLHPAPPAARHVCAVNVLNLVLNTRGARRGIKEGGSIHCRAGQGGGWVQALQGLVPWAAGACGAVSTIEVQGEASNKHEVARVARRQQESQV